MFKVVVIVWVEPKVATVRVEVSCGPQVIKDAIGNS